VTTAVIGGTGRIGGEIVHGIIARSEAVIALVPDPAEARRVFGDPGGLEHPSHASERPARSCRSISGDPHGVHRDGINRVTERPAAHRDQRRRRDLLDLDVTRLSVLNTSIESLGINQRAHYSIDEFAFSTGEPYSTIRPAIFSASLLAAAREMRASRTWTGLAGSGRMALIDHRDMAKAGLRVLTHPAFGASLGRFLACAIWDPHQRCNEVLLLTFTHGERDAG
jgi:uncharacterized protein YbjT (DUF2867 family)